MPVSRTVMCDDVSFFNCPLDITCTEGWKTKEMSFISPFIVNAVNDYTVKLIRTVLFTDRIAR